LPKKVLKNRKKKKPKRVKKENEKTGGRTPSRADFTEEKLGVLEKNSRRAPEGNDEFRKKKQQKEFGPG